MPEPEGGLPVPPGAIVQYYSQASEAIGAEGLAEERGQLVGLADELERHGLDPVALALRQPGRLRADDDGVQHEDHDDELATQYVLARRLRPDLDGAGLARLIVSRLNEDQLLGLAGEALAWRVASELLQLGFEFLQHLPDL